MKRVIHDEGSRPIHLWTEDIDEGAMQQLRNVAKLPFIHKHGVAAMPDVHWGIGAIDGSLTPPQVADLLRTIALRAGYIVGACKGEREMVLEAEEILHLVDRASKGLYHWWHGQTPPSAAASAAQEEAMRYELANARASYAKAIEILTGIYALLNPPHTKVGDKTYEFQNPHANEVLQALSDAIRAIPAEMRTPSSTGVLETPRGHEDAKRRIEECVREIQIISDTFGYDPYEWLADDDPIPVKGA